MKKMTLEDLKDYVSKLPSTEDWSDFGTTTFQELAERAMLPDLNSVVNFYNNRSKSTHTGTLRGIFKCRRTGDWYGRVRQDVTNKLFIKQLSKINTNNEYSPKETIPSEFQGDN